MILLLFWKENKMFLSQVEINPRRRMGRELISNPEKLHATVESICRLPDEGQRILWRLDSGKNSSKLLIVTPVKPSLNVIREQAGWESQPETAKSVSYDRFLSSIQSGQRFRFRLTANPAYKKNGKLKAHVGPANQLKWLFQRSDRLGVSFDEFSTGVVSSNTHVFRNKGNKVTLPYATYEGILSVQDVENVQDALVNGIGRGRAYGMGLMTLAPL